MRLKASSLVLSVSENDCGPAALATILRHHGRWVTLPELRTLIGTTQRGSSLRGIVETATSMGMDTASYRVKNLTNITLNNPVLAHYDDTPLGHFVVVSHIDDGSIVVFDPAFGQSSVDPKDFRRRWSGIFVSFEPTSNFQRTSRRLNIRPLIAACRGNAVNLLPAIVAGLGGIALSFTTALFLRWVVDRLFKSDKHFELGLVFLVACTATLLRGGLSLIRGKAVRSAGDTVETDLATAYIEMLVSQPLETFTRATPGELFTRLGDAARARQALTTSLIAVLIDSIFALTASLLLVMANARLIIIVVLYGAGVTLLTSLQRHPVFETERLIRREHGTFASSFMEACSAIRTIKSNNAEQFTGSRLVSHYLRAVKVITRREALGDYYTVGTNVLSMLCMISLIYVGALLVARRQLTAGEFLFCYAGIGLFLPAADKLASSILAFSEGYRAFLRLGEEGTHASRSKDHDLPPILPMSDALRLHKITFCYERDQPIIEHIDLHIGCQEVVALAGVTGCGKSTIAAVLAGLLKPTSGFISVDGQVVENELQLRQRVGIVFQDPQLFQGSIRDNITIGLECSPEQIREAAVICDIHDQIESLPKGYETPLGAAGMTLSSGQRQRIALCRAVLRKPAVLVLDEATSNLDMATESRVMRNILRHRQGLSTLVISHRPTITALASRVIHVANGRVHHTSDAINNGIVEVPALLGGSQR